MSLAPCSGHVFVSRRLGRRAAGVGSSFYLPLFNLVNNVSARPPVLGEEASESLQALLRVIVNVGALAWGFLVMKRRTRLLALVTTDRTASVADNSNVIIHYQSDEFAELFRHKTCMRGFSCCVLNDIKSIAVRLRGFPTRGGPSRPFQTLPRRYQQSIGCSNTLLVGLRVCKARCRPNAAVGDLGAASKCRRKESKFSTRSHCAPDLMRCGIACRRGLIFKSYGALLSGRAPRGAKGKKAPD